MPQIIIFSNIWIRFQSRVRNQRENIYSSCLSRRSKSHFKQYTSNDIWYFPSSTLFWFTVFPFLHIPFHHTYEMGYIFCKNGIYNYFSNSVTGSSPHSTVFAISNHKIDKNQPPNFKNHIYMNISNWKNNNTHT